MTAEYPMEMNEPDPNGMAAHDLVTQLRKGQDYFGPRLSELESIINNLDTDPIAKGHAEVDRAGVQYECMLLIIKHHSVAIDLARNNNYDPAAVVRQEQVLQDSIIHAQQSTEFAEAMGTDTASLHQKYDVSHLFSN